MLPYVRSLDKLRGIAVLLILFTHTPLSLKGDIARWMQVYLAPGYSGVDIFFALSGFLITRILLHDRAEGASLRGFWIRRALRIFPAFYLLVAVVWIATPGPEMPWVAGYLSNFYFMGDVPPSNLGHTWSLAIEEQFYLLWPLVIYGLSRRRAWQFISFGIVPIAIACAAYVAVEYPRENLKISYYFTPIRALTLALGGLLAFAEPSLRRRPWTWGLSSVLVGFFGYFVYLGGFVIPAMRRFDSLYMMLGFALVSTSLVVLFISCDRIPMPRIAALIGTPLAYIGRISYGLYLYFMPVFIVREVHQRGSEGTLTNSHFIGTIAIVFAVTMTSYYLVERPLLRWGRRTRLASRTNS